MHAYKNGLTAGPELEKAVKKVQVSPKGYITCFPHIWTAFFSCWQNRSKHLCKKFMY